MPLRSNAKLAIIVTYVVVILGIVMSVLLTILVVQTIDTNHKIADQAAAQTRLQNRQLDQLDQTIHNQTLILRRAARLAIRNRQGQRCIIALLTDVLHESGFDTPEVHARHSACEALSEPIVLPHFQSAPVGSPVPSPSPSPKPSPSPSPSPTVPNNCPPHPKPHTRCWCIIHHC